ncbi:MAG: AMP-binding protein [Burkholderiales bacterium]
MDALDTFPKLLARNAREFGGKTALREKQFGIWRSFSWQQYHDRVRDFSLGLVSLGFEPGDKVAIIGGNRPEWVCAELATQGAGGASVGIYQDSNLNEVAFVIDHCDATFVVAEDQEQVDKILEMIDTLPKLKKVIYTDPRGMRKYDHPTLLGFNAVEAQGRALHLAEPNRWEQNIAQGKGSDTAIISYTSGTTGFPKGAVLTFDNLIVMAQSVNAIDRKFSSDEFVSFLPLAWIGEQMVSVTISLLVGFTINFPEDPNTVLEDIREIGPHSMFAPPRVWENMNSTVQVKIMDTTPFKRFMYNLFMPVGHKIADLKFKKQGVPLHWALLHKLSYWLLFRPLKDRLGLSNLRTCSTGGAAMGPDVFRFFHALGVPLKQLYGQTEISGISCIHPDGDVQFHTVGKPIPGTEVMIAADGEILSRSRSVTPGYYKNDEATKQAIRDGWLHSGDAGYLTEDGQLVVIDRIKDVMRLADGTQFSPQYIENRLKFSPYIKEAVVIGSDRPKLTAMICIDMSIVGKWAENNKLSYTTYTDLAAKPPVYDLLEKEVAKVNETLPLAAKLKRFVLLYKELDADDEELTRTRKVRRGLVEERYKDVIDALYSDKTSVPMDATIKFQDGKTARFQTTLLVRDLA